MSDSKVVFIRDGKEITLEDAEEYIFVDEAIFGQSQLKKTMDGDVLKIEIINPREFYKTEPKPEEE